MFLLDIAEMGIEKMREAVLLAPEADAEELVLRLADEWILSDPITAVARTATARAWIACVLAERARDEGDTAAAWHYVSEARYEQGRLDADHIAMERIDRIRAAGRKGGQRSGLRRSPLMRECVHLLQTLRPEAGWTSHKQAFNCLYPELLDFCTREGEGENASREELWQRVEKWLTTNPEMLEAYSGGNGGT